MRVSRFSENVGAGDLDAAVCSLDPA